MQLHDKRDPFSLNKLQRYAGSDNRMQVVAGSTLNLLLG